MHLAREGLDRPPAPRLRHLLRLGRRPRARHRQLRRGAGHVHAAPGGHHRRASPVAAGHPLRLLAAGRLPGAGGGVRRAQARLARHPGVRRRLALDPAPRRRGDRPGRRHGGPGPREGGRAGARARGPELGRRAGHPAGAARGERLPPGPRPRRQAGGALLRQHGPGPRRGHRARGRPPAPRGARTSSSSSSGTEPGDRRSRPPRASCPRSGSCPTSLGRRWPSRSRRGTSTW